MCAIAGADPLRWETNNALFAALGIQGGGSVAAMQAAVRNYGRALRNGNPVPIELLRIAIWLLQHAAAEGGTTFPEHALADILLPGTDMGGGTLAPVWMSPFPGGAVGSVRRIEYSRLPADWTPPPRGAEVSTTPAPTPASTPTPAALESRTPASTTSTAPAPSPDPSPAPLPAPVSNIAPAPARSGLSGGVIALGTVAAAAGVAVITQRRPRTGRTESA